MTAQIAQATPKVYTAEDYIPMEVWGKDHWSTLAYMETIIVERAHFPVAYDPRMRSNRRNFRVMTDTRALAHATATNRGFALNGRGPDPITATTGYGTRLNTGQEVKGHDDWACVQDMAMAGLLAQTVDDIEPGEKLTLSERGWAVIHALREHKARGGNFASFVYAEVQP